MATTRGKAPRISNASETPISATEQIARANDFIRKNTTQKNVLEPIKTRSSTPTKKRAQSPAPKTRIKDRTQSPGRSDDDVKENRRRNKADADQKSEIFKTQPQQPQEVNDEVEEEVCNLLS